MLLPIWEYVISLYKIDNRFSKLITYSRDVCEPFVKAHGEVQAIMSSHAVFCRALLRLLLGEILVFSVILHLTFQTSSSIALF